MGLQTSIHGFPDRLLGRHRKGHVRIGPGMVHTPATSVNGELRVLETFLRLAPAKIRSLLGAPRQTEAEIKCEAAGRPLRPPHPSPTPDIGQLPHARVRAKRVPGRRRAFKKADLKTPCFDWTAKSAPQPRRKQRHRCRRLSGNQSGDAAQCNVPRGADLDS